MSEKITKTVSGSTTLDLFREIGERRKKEREEALKKQKKDKLIEERNQRKKEQKIMLENGYITKVDIASFLKKAISEIESEIASSRAGLPESVRVEVSGAHMANRNVPISIGILNGKLFAYTVVRFSREGGAGWSPSVCPHLRWKYNAPNGMSGFSPMTNGADLITLFNNGWDTSDEAHPDGKVLWYYAKERVNSKKSNKTGNHKTGKLTGRIRKGDNGSKVRIPTQWHKDPLYFVNNAVEKVSSSTGVNILLNEYLYDLRGRVNTMGMYSSGLDIDNPAEMDEDAFYYYADNVPHIAGRTFNTLYGGGM